MSLCKRLREINPSLLPEMKKRIKIILRTKLQDGFFVKFQKHKGYASDVAVRKTVVHDYPEDILTDLNRTAIFHDYVHRYFAFIIGFVSLAEFGSYNIQSNAIKKEAQKSQMRNRCSPVHLLLICVVLVEQWLGTSRRKYTFFGFSGKVSKRSVKRDSRFVLDTLKQIPFIR